MGLIQIEGMEFYAFHGHFDQEKIVGNKFLLDLTIETDCTKPADTDDLNDAVNYQKAYELVKEQMQYKSNLLENIAKRILDAITNEFDNIERISVKISKINPPMGGHINKVSVTLSRDLKSMK